MAVKFITAHDVYSGLSTDSKPTSKRVGSTFRETDTGKSYVYDGTSWNKDFPKTDGLYTGSLVEIDVVHDEVHRGDHWSATYSEGIGSGSSSIILFETPGSAVTDVHFIGVLAVSAAGSITFQEAPNTTAGTVITPYNNKREQTGSSGVIIITSNGAITSAGTILANEYVGGGSNSKIGGETGLRNEWILEHSTRYVLEYVSSAASVVAWNLLWYEES